MIRIEAGQLRTPVEVLTVNSIVYTDGFSAVSTSPALTHKLYVQWLDGRGDDIQPAANRRKATLRCRWTEAVTRDCIILYRDETWEIVSCEDVQAMGRWMELQLTRQARRPGGPVTLWTPDKTVLLDGAALDQTDGAGRVTDGLSPASGLTLIIPREAQAVSGQASVSWCRPAAYAALSATAQAGRYTITPKSFFAPGDHRALTGSYQTINAALDGVSLVQRAVLRNQGSACGEYLEVTGR